MKIEHEERVYCDNTSLNTSFGTKIKLITQRKMYSNTSFLVTYKYILGIDNSISTAITFNLLKQSTFYLEYAFLFILFICSVNDVVSREVDFRLTTGLLCIAFFLFIKREYSITTVLLTSTLFITLFSMQFISNLLHTSMFIGFGDIYTALPISIFCIKYSADLALLVLFELLLLCTLNTVCTSKVISDKLPTRIKRFIVTTPLIPVMSLTVAVFFKLGLTM